MLTLTKMLHGAGTKSTSTDDLHVCSKRGECSKFAGVEMLQTTNLPSLNLHRSTHFFQSARSGSVQIVRGAMENKVSQVTSKQPTKSCSSSASIVMVLKAPNNGTLFDE